jgi:hypothetical protein
MTQVMKKHFASAKSMENWLSSPLNQKLYHVIFVNYDKNRILVEGRPAE